MNFQTWGELNKSAKEILKPDFGLRQWYELSVSDREIIWQHLLPYFFDRKLRRDEYGDYYYSIDGDSQMIARVSSRIFKTIYQLNKLYIARNFAPTFLENPTYLNANADFLSIFLSSEENTALELLSLYAKAIIEEPKGYYSRESNESDEDYQKRKTEWEWIRFDDFVMTLMKSFLISD